MLLSVDPSNIPTTTRGDGCAVNTKGNGCAVSTSWWKVWYQGLLFKVLINLASGTIRCFCTSIHYSQQDAITLYENLRTLLKHFARNVKSMELLNGAPDIINRNSVHILNWECTRMASFLDPFVQSSRIIVAFLDNLVNHKTRQDEIEFIASPKGVYLLQLFTDFHPVFTNR